MSHRSDRRDFLKKSTAVLAGATMPYWFTSTSNLALGRQSVNDRPVLGCIGTGGQWSSVGRNAMEYSDCVAVCDVDRNRVEKGRDRVKELQGKRGLSTEPQMYEDYRKLLDRNDIQVVTIVTPDHWHSKIAIEAMQAGKDVYCEKPLTLTILEGKQIIKVLNETKRVFQVGTQQRSDMSAKTSDETTIRNQFLKAVAIARSGRLGTIKKIKCSIGTAPESAELPKAEIPEGLNWDMWLGQAPMTDYLQGGFGNNNSQPESRCHYEFRWWYEYSGGKLTDWGAHHVDIAMWALGMDNSGPISVEGTATHPVPLVNGMPTVSNRYNTATAFNIVAKFATGVEIHVQNDGDNGVTIEGTDGQIFVSRSKLLGTAVDDLAKNPLPESLLKELYKGKLNKEGRTAHMENFFDCVKDRGLPVSDVYSHHRAMTTCHLANIAIRLGRKIEWDPKTEQIINDKDAAKWIGREQRKGYEINVSV